MYHVKSNRIRVVYIISAMLLWMMIFGMTVFGAEVPGGGTAVDGTIRNVDAAEVSKGSEMVSASSIPGETQEEKGNSGSVGPVGSEAPHKTETPGDHTDGVRVSDASPASFSSSGSPVVTCGAGKAASLSKEVVPEDTPGKGASLGMFTTTGYCLCEECSGGFGLTYSGTVPKSRHTISADASLFPMGTRLMIEDIVYTVEDIGSNVIGSHIDIFYDTHEDAVAHGRQLQEVFMVH